MVLLKKTGKAPNRRPAGLFLCIAAVIILLAACATGLPRQVKVSFELNGGTWPDPVQSQEKVLKNGAPYRTAAEGIPDPVRRGYTFAGWYFPSSSSSAIQVRTGVHTMINDVADMPITEDTVLHAGWQANVAFVRLYEEEGKRELILGITANSRLLDKNGAPITDASKYLNGTYTGTDLPIFKDLNGNGKLDVYEDWRKPVENRVEDLANKLAADPKGIVKMAGLMLYSSHQRVTDPYITREQYTFLKDDYLRHVLVAQVDDPLDAALWNNNVQAYLEDSADDYGIPANNSSDPRHGSLNVTSAEYATYTGGISAWPSSLGIAATFNPETMLNFGKIASSEYRLMGIATALSPQIDIATDPRWNRFNGTFGEDPKLARDMTAAYVRGFQSSYALRSDGLFEKEASGGWGPYSVNAMIKHWPGGGSGEGGQDAHHVYGKYAVYPGGNFNAHLIPFVDGAFGANVGPTGKATAVMPYYTISYLQVPGSEPNSSDLPGAKLNMANAYSDYMITELLRGAYRFKGVICTDWGVVGPNRSPEESMFGRTPGMIWGVDDHYPDMAGYGAQDRQRRADMLLRAGINQFGGLNTIEPIVDAYKANEGQIKPFILSSAKALLTNIFAPGLFENPYVNIEEAKKLLGHQKFIEAGYQAQLDSMVLLKNKNSLLPLAEGAKIFVPGAATKREQPKTVNDDTLALLKAYFGDANVITDPAKASNATASLVFGSSLISGGGSYAEDRSVVLKPAGLDYKVYTAAKARAVSIAGAPIRDASGKVIERTNNSYKDKQADPFAPIPGFFRASPSTLAHFLEDISLATAAKKPIIFSITLQNPMVLEDIEPLADAILVDFENQKAAILDMIRGQTQNGAGAGLRPIQPRGMLPMQMPRNMETVETQNEDVPRDMIPYRDSEGNTWDFGFGLSYGGKAPLPIPAAYAQPPLTTPENQDGAAAIAGRIAVRFDYDGDGKAECIKIVRRGTAVSDVVDPPAPVRPGYRLDGWLSGQTVYNFANPVREAITLNARWVKE
jgi:beta-glucosidase